MQPSSESPRVPPALALGVAVAAVSTSAILVEWSDAPSLVKALYRVLFTTLLVAPAAMVRNPGAMRSLPRRDLLGAGVAGVALAVHFGAWFESLNWTSVAASVTLVQAQPVFVAVGAVFLLDERFTRKMALGIAVALGGMVLMSAGDLVGTPAAGATRPLYGDALAVLGAFAAAVYVLAGRSLRRRISLLPYVTVVYAACTVVLFGLVLAGGYPLFDYPPEEWALFLGMALGPGIFGHTVVNWALAHVESSVVSVSLLGEPVVSTLLAVALLGEVPGALTVLGGGVVLAGIYVTAEDREA
ncbi:DMT family transporter [Halomarina litorea]|uniref:DMT family transporter n=1 Tax=Halomarina litorea TaxID=2961595 RepID=UPI0020C326D2|nr:DMT family transporter [Halomarina sp. BCD28]